MSHSPLARHASDSCVAFGEAESRTARQLWMDVEQVAAALPEARRDGQLLLVFRSDGYAFLTTLWAALAVGHRVALPYDTGREAVLALAEDPRTQLVLHDTPSGAGLRVDSLLASACAVGEPSTAGCRVPDESAPVVLHGRGPGAGFCRYEKTFGALCSEASALVAALDLGTAGRFVSSVPWSQPFGLVAGVLAPLLSGGAFARQLVLSAGAAERAIPAQERGVWISPPYPVAKSAVGEGRGRLVRVVVGAHSAHGYPFADVERRLQMNVAAVIGGYEEGCVLYRPHTGADYALLPGVVAHPDSSGRLCVDASPWLSRRTEQPLVTRLLVTTIDGVRFRCLGSYEDRWTLHGKDRSLRELSARLSALPGLCDAALCVPERGPYANRLLVAVVPSSAPGARGSLPTHPPVSNERSPLDGAPRAYACSQPLPTRAESSPLAQLEELVRRTLAAMAELPARVLVLDAVPRDPLGEPLRDALLRRFELRPDGRPLCLDLSFSAPELKVDGAGCEALFRTTIPDEYAYFDGHFPGYPILPGAVQLSELVLPCVRQVRPELGALSEMSRLKFLGRILPGAQVGVSITWTRAQPSVEFALHSVGTLCAAGKFSFVPEASE